MMTQHQQYRFHRGIPIAVPAEATPIYDQLFLERALADQEGKDLVEAIHERNSYAAFLVEERIAAQVTRPRSLAAFLGNIAGLFR